MQNSELCVVHSRQSVVPSESMASESAKNHVQKIFRGIWKNTDRFMGTNPVSIERQMLNDLSDDLLVSLKSDGVRYMLVLTMFNDEPLSVMVDRKMKMYEIEVWGEESFFHDTILDGELVWEHGYTNPRLKFLLFDCIRVAGESCDHMCYSDRLMKLHNLVLMNTDSASVDTIEQRVLDECKIVCMNNPVPLTLFPKRFVQKSHAKSLWEERYRSCHKNDGIIIARNVPREHNKRSVYKWKPDNTIDVRLRTGAEGTDGMTIWIGKDGTDLNITSSLRASHTTYEVRLQTNDMVQYALDTCAKSGTVLDSIFECACTLEDNVVTFFPIKHRPDKPSANDKRTVLATIKNVQEAIDITEVLDIFGRDAA